MATMSPPDERREWLNSKYKACLIKPMGGSNGQLVHAEHVIDAVLVAAIVFFATILGEFWISGQVTYLTVSDITSRLPTAAIAFCLTFFTQWARARGIDVLGRLRDLVGS